MRILTRPRRPSVKPLLAIVIMLKLLKDYLPVRWPDRDEIGWLLFPVIVALCLLAFDRYGIQARYVEFFGAQLQSEGLHDNEIQFRSQVWLSSACIVLMIVIPCVYLWLFPRSHTWGLGFGHGRQHLALYALMMTGMLPILWIAAGSAGFVHYYPFYNPTSLELWVVFELVYLTQFVCVEFFFRGPLLFRLQERFGYAAIGMMVVPYALIHIYKPAPEAVGSIFAGLLLGYLALKARTIWLGVALHCGVALSMDVFTMIRSGRLMALLSQ